MAEHGANVGGGYFYHHCAELQITADPSAMMPDGGGSTPAMDAGTADAQSGSAGSGGTAGGGSGGAGGMSGSGGKGGGSATGGQAGGAGGDSGAGGSDDTGGSSGGRRSSSTSGGCVFGGAVPSRETPFVAAILAGVIALGRRRRRR
jgi:hypothetical protein